MTFLKNLKRYHITFYLSGKDRDGNPITDSPSLSMNITHQTPEQAKEQLKNMFHDCVEVNITSCEEIPL